jgi:hypothetical protein
MSGCNKENMRFVDEKAGEGFVGVDLRATALTNGDRL